MQITRERLLQVLNYDPESGIFTWKIRMSPSAPAGGRAGTIDSNGYLKMKVDGVSDYGHRFAFMIMEGWMPDEVDHSNLNRGDNSWGNLRPATPGQQMSNRRTPKSNTSGFKGVMAAGDRWRARIKTGGKKISLGTYDTIEEAAAAYAAASAKHHGEFGRVA